MNSPDVPVAMSVCKSSTAGRPLRFLYRVLRSTLLVFRTGAVWQISWLRFALAVVVFSILTYQTACFCWVTAYSGRHLASAISIFCWQLQAWFAACILIYWQFKGHLKTLFSGICWEEFDFFNDHRLCTTCFRRYYALSGICWVAAMAYNILSVYLALTNNVHAIVNLLPEMFEIYGGRKSHFITLFVFYFSIVVWQAMLMVYVCISLSVHHELQFFNRRVANVGNKGESRETVARDLIVLYDRQVMLAGVVRKVNSAFEVYSFLMLGTNIPTTIFSSANALQRVRRGFYSAASITLPGIVFCLLEIAAITAAPAQVHSSIRALEATLFGNRHLWIPHNSAVYEISHTSIAHSKQSTLGISVWGFTLISKSLLLTAASLIVTYLTLLVELDAKEIHSYRASNLTLVPV